jgi:hypothetical protein
MPRQGRATMRKGIVKRNTENLLRLSRAGLWLLLVLATWQIPVGSAGQADGVAIEIVYDTSGSMLQKVRDTNGNLTPKYIIASRALNAVVDRLQVVAAPSPTGPAPVIQAGMLWFQGERGGSARVATAVKLGPFSPQPFRNWLAQHGQPQHGTPLGDAVRMAGNELLKSDLPRKHILVITDGINTQGPDPVVTIPKLQREAELKNTAVSLHFVAFDVNADVFSGVKKLGATVVGASDEKQLNSQLEFILSKKILLEDEEPTKPN